MRADKAAEGRIPRRARELEEKYHRPVAEVLPSLSPRVRDLEQRYQQPIYELLLEIVWLRHRGRQDAAAAELGVPPGTLSQWLVLLRLTQRDLAFRQAVLERAELTLKRELTYISHQLEDSA